ncbi:hypothetical protein [Butyrivibrio sp. AC2005]|nr:hypothetical protein [Butyrivibrio sp. AC2005]
MTRQDQQLLKELKKALPLLIKDLDREKKLKKKDFMLYKRFYMVVPCNR